jgi:general secretion pathway protein B
MSYILDALKKSEQERKQGEVPGLNSFQDHPRPPRSSSRIIIHLLSGILLIMTLAISLWLFFRDPPTPTPPESSREVITETALPQTEKPQQIENKNLPIAKGTPPEQPAIITEPGTPSPALGDLTPEPETSLSTVEPPPATAADIGGIEQVLNDDQENSAPAQPKLVTFADLPSDIRSALPELVIAAHYYASKPSSRMASINGRIMRQGQSVTDGLVLEEIIREGVILSFHDYRFSLGVFNR